MLPLSRTQMWSAISRAIGSSCTTIRIPNLPAARRSRMTSSTMSTNSGAKILRSAHPSADIPARCAAPARSPASTARRRKDGRHADLGALSAAKECEIRSVVQVASRLRAAATARCSATVSEEKIRRPCGTRPIPRLAISCAGKRVNSSPPKWMLPRRGGVRPAIDRITVVFPAPLRPISTVIRPRRTFSETPWMT